jgi:hypothetical protein
MVIDDLSCWRAFPSGLFCSEQAPKLARGYDLEAEVVSVQAEQFAVPGDAWFRLGGNCGRDDQKVVFISQV